jgi:hypothetical protein
VGLEHVDGLRALVLAENAARYYLMPLLLLQVPPGIADKMESLLVAETINSVTN